MGEREPRRATSSLALYEFQLPSPVVQRHPEAKARRSDSIRSMGPRTHHRAQKSRFKNDVLGFLVKAESVPESVHEVLFAQPNQLYAHVRSELHTQRGSVSALG